jgi:F-type H+-transporting ATPase subunit delta
MKVTISQYAKTLYESVKDKPRNEIPDIVSNFVKILSKNNQIKNSGKIISKFGDIYNQENWIIEAEVRSARKLESLQIHKVKNFLKKKYEAKEIILNNIIDEKIKGGIVIKVRDELTDASISGKLRGLKNKLSN